MSCKRGARSLRRSAQFTWKRGVALVATRARGQSVCDDVAAWAALQQGARARVLLEPERVTRTRPHTVDAELLEAYSQRAIAQQPGRYLVPIEGARLVGARGLVVLPDGSWAAESAWGAPELARDPDHLAPPRRAHVPQSGSWFSLLAHWSGTRNYYHWLHDVLVRLHGVREHLPSDTRFVVPPRLRPFQRDSLRFLGISDDRLVPFDGHETWEFETLHFAPKVSNVGSDRPAADRWLRDQLTAGAGVVPARGGRRIYISRRNAKKRRLVNEDAVEAFLEHRGFETVLTEDLTFQEQIARFAQADVLVSTHGAGLTNMLFAASGLRVVELIEPGMADVAYIYWAMADALGHEYWYFRNDSVPRRGYQPDALASLEKLEATLAAMGMVA